MDAVNNMELSRGENAVVVFVLSRKKTGPQLQI
jgi:hypothetical protein